MPRAVAKPTLPPMANLLACSCLRLRQVNRKGSQIYDRALEPAGMTSPQFALLVHLVAKPGLGMKALADAMGDGPHDAQTTARSNGACAAGSSR
jgi:hypothetical protein